MTYAVQIWKAGVLNFQSADTDVIPAQQYISEQTEFKNWAHAQSFIVNADGEIAVIDKLIDREHGIIRLDEWH